jgi:RNA polymerase sigma factor (sigma-70 family)
MAATRTSDDDRTDERLVEAVRNGDREAFAALYRRYSPLAFRFACRLLGSAQNAEDLVSEAFAKVLGRLVIGGGPTKAFSSYLLTTVRTTLYKQLAADRLIDHQAELPEPQAAETDPLAARLDASLAVRAFQSLSERWQSVLWHLEVENKSTSVVAELLAIRPNAVAALAFRARDALRVAYLQMHVNADVDSACKESADNLAAWLCGRLQRGLRSRVQEHVGECAACTNAVAELSDLIAQLRRMVPLTINEPAVGVRSDGAHRTYSVEQPDPRRCRDICDSGIPQQDSAVGRSSLPPVVATPAG